jgi:hypothetical protein
MSPYCPYFPVPSHQAQVSGAYCITGMTIFTPPNRINVIIHDYLIAYPSQGISLILSENGYTRDALPRLHRTN